MGEMRGIGRIRIHDGKLDEFKRLAERCVELVKAHDPGTVGYAVNINEAGTEALVFEHYADSEAGLAHARTVAEISKEIAAIADMSGDVWGDPSPDLRAMLEESGVRLYRPFVSI